jgi:hypothetical protein
MGRPDRIRDFDIPLGISEANSFLCLNVLEPPPSGTAGGGQAQEGQSGIRQGGDRPGTQPDGPLARQERAPRATTAQEVTNCLGQIEQICRAVGLTEEQRRAVLHMATLLARGNRDSLNELNQWCGQFAANPQELNGHFANLARVLQRMGINATVRPVSDAGGQLAVARLDIPCGNGNWLRFASRPANGGFVVSEGTAINAQGEVTPIFEALPGRSPYGAGRIIARTLVDNAGQRQRER